MCNLERLDLKVKTLEQHLNDDFQVEIIDQNGDVFVTLDSTTEAKAYLKELESMPKARAQLYQLGFKKLKVRLKLDDVLSVCMAYLWLDQGGIVRIDEEWWEGRSQVENYIPSDWGWLVSSYLRDFVRSLKCLDKAWRSQRAAACGGDMPFYLGGV